MFYMSLSTLLQSYQDDGKMIMQSCVQWNPFMVEKIGASSKLLICLFEPHTFKLPKEMLYIYSVLKQCFTTSSYNTGNVQDLRFSTIYS